MDIVVWLRSLGLGKYEAAFRENEIDETVLPDLTHETLQELLGAIAALRTDAVAKPPASDGTAPSGSEQFGVRRSEHWTVPSRRLQAA